MQLIETSDKLAASSFDGPSAMPQLPAENIYIIKSIFSPK